MPLINQFDEGSVMAKEWLGQFGVDHRVKKIIEDTMISDETEGLKREEKPVKIGIIGAGAIAQRGHIPEFSSIKGVHIEAIADCDFAKAKIVAQKAGIPRVFKDYQEMLALEELDAVSVCTPNYLHAPVTVAACDAGKHVLCEKPMATSMSGAREMIAAAERNGVILMIEQAKRFTPSIQVAKALLRKGIVGDMKGWMDISDTLIYFYNVTNHQLDIISIGDPANPVKIDTVDKKGSGDSYKSPGVRVVYKEGKVYYTSGGYLGICDVTDPVTPREIYRSDNQIGYPIEVR